MEIRPVDLSDAGIASYVKLFEECFPTSAMYSAAYLEWQYRDNPRGLAVGFDAWDGDVLAAHYATIPQAHSLNGTCHSALLSLNTATGPNYRNQGLFVKLANSTYEHAATLGVQFVVGVANANSTPGFIRRLGFTSITQLEARIGLGLGVAPGVSQLETLLDDATIKWRCSSPRNQVHGTTQGKKTRFWAATDQAPLIVVADRFTIVPPPEPTSQPRRLELFVGLIPASARFTGISLSIPQRLRPSPLNFIFLPLQSSVTPPSRDNISFDFLDFDAF